MSARKKSVPAAEPPEVTAEVQAVETEETGATREPEAVEAAPAVPRFAVTFPRGLNLREGPGRQHKVVTVLPMGTVVLAAGAAEGGWLPVACDLGAGWVDVRYLAAVEG